MAARYEDWMAQAERDLEHARHSVRDADYEWASFASQQAAEKAVKAVCQKLGGEARGHSIIGLLRGLAPKINVPKDLQDVAKELDSSYIGARYPDAFPDGAPFDMYTDAVAKRMIAYAKSILEFCKSHLA